MFFYFALMYFMVACYDLFIASFMTFRTLLSNDQYDRKWVLINQDVDLVLSTICAVIFLLCGLALIIGFCIHGCVKKKKEKKEHLRFKLFRTPKYRIFFLTQFFSLRVILAIIACFAGVGSSIAVASVFFGIILISFTLSAYIRCFHSCLLHFANLLLEFSLLLLSMLTIIEESIGREDAIGIFFLSVLILVLFIVIILLIIDIIYKCCVYSKREEWEKEKIEDEKKPTEVGLKK